MSSRAATVNDVDTIAATIKLAVLTEPVWGLSWHASTVQLLTSTGIGGCSSRAR
jgi:hypothetical protein